MMWIRNGADYFIKATRGKRNAAKGDNTANAAKDLWSWSWRIEWEMD
ncbi:MAG: hypothetical protein IIW14_07440 [Kiritimatiellae bacterium]|nr:hypothetical protein [Kiritimatiellia bacterium]